MSQLIALIIAIALGAIVTAIGYVFLGDAFTNNSNKGIAQQLINQGEQIKLSMMAFKVMNSRSAFVTDYDTTMSNNGSGGAGTSNGLIPEGFIKGEVSPPLGITYEMHLYLGNHFITYRGTELNNEICAAINNDTVENSNSWTSPFSVSHSDNIQLQGGKNCTRNGINLEEFFYSFNVGS
jgi:hypothetical protein